MHEAECSDLFFLCDVEDALLIAGMLDEVPGLSVAECATFCQAPVDTSSEKSMKFLLDYALGYAECRGWEAMQEQEKETNEDMLHFADLEDDDDDEGALYVPANLRVPRGIPRTPFMIQQLEQMHKVADV